MAVIQLDIGANLAPFMAGVKNMQQMGKAAGDQFEKGFETATSDMKTPEIGGGLKGKFAGIGNEAKQAFTGAFAGFAAANLMGSAISTITTGFSEAVGAARTFNSGMAELAAVTGMSGAGLDAMGDSARDLALRFGTDVNAQISSFS